MLVGCQEYVMPITYQFKEKHRWFMPIYPL